MPTLQASRLQGLQVAHPDALMQLGIHLMVRLQNLRMGWLFMTRIDSLSCYR